jgi:hypothetical protein
MLEFIQLQFSPTLNEACLFENKGHAVCYFVSKLVEEKENGNILYHSTNGNKLAI